MILASSLRRASGVPHSSTALNPLVEALFLPWSVSMSSDAPYWRPPTPLGQYGRSTRNLWSRARFWITSGWPTIREFFGSVNSSAFFISAVDWLVRKAGCPVDQAQALTFSKLVTELLQLGVFCLGLLKDRNIRIGVFPEGEEILIRGSGLCRIALQNVGAPELHMRQGSDGFVQHGSPMIEDLLKLCRSFPATVSRKKGFSAHINGIHVGPVVKATRRQTEFIRSSDLETINRLLRIGMDKRQLGAKGRKVIELYIRVFNEPFFETLHESLGRLCVFHIRRCQPESIIDVASARWRHCHPCLF